MDEDSQKRQEGGRFRASTTLDEVIAVFDQVRGPVVTSTDVAEVCDCSGKTARRKLDELADQGRIDGRETAGRTVWWRTSDGDGEDDPEVRPDGGVALCPECGDPAVDVDRIPPSDPLNDREDGQDVVHFAHRIVDEDVVTDYCASADIDTNVSGDGVEEVESDE